MPFPPDRGPGPAVAAALLAATVSLATLAAQAPAAFVIPTTDPAGWEVLRYRNIPGHEVRFGPGGLTIEVRASAAPVVYPLPMPLAAGALEVRGRLEGALALAPGRQGEDGYDDYALRAGVVLTGTRRPSLVERLFAAGWVKRLFALAPEGGGISEVRFFNLAAEPGHVGDTRRHPLNDLLAEAVVAVPGADGRFAFTAPLGTSERALAVWLGADGDDTGSSFTVSIERLALLPAP